jgi:hypothetical protein
MTTDWIQAGSAVVTALATLGMIWLGWANLKTAKAIAWYTGAMESHSHLNLILEAKKMKGDRDIELIWRDPSVEPTPVEAVHKEPVNKKSIYVYLPAELRLGKVKKRYAIAG